MIAIDNDQSFGSLAPFDVADLGIVQSVGLVKSLNALIVDGVGIGVFACELHDCVGSV